MKTNFAKNLRALLARSGKKQQEVADFIGVSISSLQRYLHSRSKPQNKELYYIIAEYFGVDVNTLLFGEIAEENKDADEAKTGAEKKPQLFKLLSDGKILMEIKIFS